MEHYYTFLVGKTPEVIKARTMELALTEVIDNHLFSFFNRKVIFISSNDPDAPKDERLVYTTGLFAPTTMKSINTEGK
jgi:hypothetical protein